jgi:lactoylglutathione lyase
MLLGIGHNAVNALDMDKLLDFYTGAAGFQRAFEIPRDGKPWIIYLKAGEDGFLELFYGGEKDREDNNGADLIGYHHWSVTCAGLPALRERIAGKNYAAGDIKPAEDGKGGLAMRTQDPEGNILDIVQPKPTAEYGGREGILGIGSIALVCKDLAKSLDFYCGKLGMRELRTVEQGGRIKSASLQVREGQTYELCSPEGAGRTRPNTWQSYGGNLVSIQVDSVEQTVEELRRRGTAILAEPKVGADKNTQAWILDPDGNRVELMYIHPDSPQARAGNGAGR